MHLSDELYDQMRVAWAGPAPAIPEEWKEDYDCIECQDTHVFLSGKLWDEVICEEMPRYFNPLGIMDQDLILRGVPGYYIASLMRCVLAVDGDNREFAVLHVEDLLGHAVHDPIGYGLTPMRCRAIAAFLDMTRADFEDNGFYIADQWQELASSSAQ